MKIVVLRDNQEHATALLRYFTPFYYLQKAGHSIKYLTEVTYSKDEKTLVNPEIIEADIVVSGQFLFEEDLPAIRAIKNMGKKVILDADDWYVESHLKRPKSDIEAYKEIARLADGITVVSRYLGELYVRKIGVDPKKIHYLPNACLVSQWEAYPLAPKRKDITIGLMGATQHVLDWVRHALPVLREIKKKYPEVKFSCFGKPRSITSWILHNKDLIQEQFLLDVASGFAEMEEMGFEFVAPAAKQEEFVPKMRGLGWHIGLATLSNNRQDKGKSYLKYFDYSMAGIAGVYQGISPFTEVIEDEVNGMVANSKQEWIDKISLMIENEGWRDAIVQTANSNIKTHHNFNKEWKKWLKVYENILNS